jgi:hypothetical protein
LGAKLALDILSRSTAIWAALAQLLTAVLSERAPVDLDGLVLQNEHAASMMELYERC